MTVQDFARAAGRAMASPWITAAAFLILLANPFPAAAGGGIAIELNKADTANGRCLGSFVLTNGLGATLDRFELDLFVFGTDGIIKQRSSVNLAPLRGDKTTVITFPILNTPCEAVGRVLINDIPQCRSEAGGKLDCLSGLSVSIRARIELVK